MSRPVWPAWPGDEAGVRAGAGAAVGASLVGVVAYVEARLAWVRALEDPDCRVAVAIVPPSAASLAARGGAAPTGPFVLRGRGPHALPRVAFVERGVDVREGDLVVTSGAQGLLPEGLLVGRVVGVDNADADAMLEVDVAPAQRLADCTGLAFLLRADASGP